MRTKRNHLLFLKPRKSITADLFPNFGARPIKSEVRSHEDKRHIVIETSDKAGVIPTSIDHDLCAQSRRPMDIIFQG